MEKKPCTGDIAERSVGATLPSPVFTASMYSTHTTAALGRGSVNVLSYTLSTVVASASLVHISPLQPGTETTGCVRVLPDPLRSCCSG